MSENQPEPNCEQALSLYTFYEGRVQSTKSILVGVLAGILSLQASFLNDIFKHNSPSLVNALPLIFLFIISIPVFRYMKRHMEDNVIKSKHFEGIVEKHGVNYRPNLAPSKLRFQWQLDWIFVVCIGLLAVLSLVFII